MRWLVLLLIIISPNVFSEGIGPPHFSPSEQFTLKYTIMPTVFTTMFTNYLFDSTSSSQKSKVVKSKSDAAAYIASDAQIGSVYLEQALVMLRKEYPNASDMELAKAILAY